MRFMGVPFVGDDERCSTPLEQGMGETRGIPEGSWLVLQGGRDAVHGRPVLEEEEGKWATGRVYADGVRGGAGAVSVGERMTSPASRGQPLPAGEGRRVKQS